MRNKIFDISFEIDGIKYSGWVNPSGQVDSNGKPASFHVVLNGVSFGYLSVNECKWQVDEDRPASLVNAVSQQIEKHYQL